MMISEILNALRLISYKPGSSIKLSTSKHQFGIVEFIFSRLVVDSRDPSVVLEINHASQVDCKLIRDVDCLVAFVGDLIRSAEMHEMNEFFKFDGQLVSDPHEGEIKIYANNPEFKL